MNSPRKRALLILLAGFSCSCASQGEPSTAAARAIGAGDRFELPEAGPMVLPVPAIVLGVKGDERVRDDLTICWTFVVNGDPAQIGVSVADDSAITKKTHVALDLIKRHGEFTLNIPDTTWIKAFDEIDMTASYRRDKFDHSGLTRLPSKKIDAPGIAEAAIVLECRVLQSHRLPPKRTVFFAEVVRATVHPGVTDSTGRLDSTSRGFFGMTSGNGEFWTFGKKVGRIGMTVGRDDIRY